MAFAVGSTTQVALVPETTFGTTPATPAFSVLRVLRSSLRSNKTMLSPAEISVNRNVISSVPSFITASGDLEGELSYGTYDEIFASAFMSTWSSDVLKNGGTPKFFTIEEKNPIGGSTAYTRFPGCMVDQLSISLSTRQAISVRASIKAMKEVTASTAISGATYAAANTKPIQAAPAGVAAISFGSYTVKAKSLSFNIKNNLMDRDSLDSLYSLEYGLGTCNVDGEISIYFQDATVYDEMIAGTSFAISTTIGTTTGEKYTISIPNAIPGDVNRSTREQNQDIMVTVPFVGIYDSSSSSSISITRAVT